MPEFDFEKDFSTYGLVGFFIVGFLIVGFEILFL